MIRWIFQKYLLFLGVRKLRRVFSMKFRGIKIVLLMLLAVSSLAVTAQNQSAHTKVSKLKPAKSTPKVSTEFGLGIGARYNWFNVQPISSTFTPKITMKMSYGAALQFRLNIGKFFGIQPEISYAYSTLRINDKTNNFSAKSKFNMVQIPLLLSLRIAMFRINAGPVFTLMDNPTYPLRSGEDGAITQMPLGKIFPTITYTAGISVKFAKCMIIDLRYADQFTNIKSVNSYIWSLDKAVQPEAQTFRTNCRSIQLRIGYAF